MDGLEEDFEFVATQAGIVQEVGSGGLAGKQQHAAGRDEGADLDGRLNPADSRHDDIGEKDIGMKSARGIDGVLPVIDRGGFVAVLGKDQPQRIGDDMLIVGDKDASPGSRRGVRIHWALHKCAQTTGEDDSNETGEW